MQHLYEVESLLKEDSTLEQLHHFVQATPSDALRDYLHSQFTSLQRYRSLSEWNRAVKICECLAVLGWGEIEPLEASSSIFVNGSPITGFYDKFGNQHHLFAMWSKKGGALGIDPLRSWTILDGKSIDLKQFDPEFEQRFEHGTLLSQQTRIPQNPIKLGCLINNAWPELEAIRDAVKGLRTFLDKHLWKTNYGAHQITVGFSFEYSNSSLESATAGLGGSLYGFENGLISFRRYSKKYKAATVIIFLSKGFANDSLPEQYENLIELILYTLEQTKVRSLKNMSSFRFDDLIGDAKSVMHRWKAEILST